MRQIGADGDFALVPEVGAQHTGDLAQRQLLAEPFVGDLAQR